MSAPVIVAEQLTKRFGDLVAVDQVDLALEAGALCGLIGPNGAGKTTLVHLLTNLYLPTSGSVRILGKRFDREPLAIKQQLGVLPEGLALYERLTGEEYLAFRAEVFGLPRAVARARMSELFEFTELVPVRRKPIHQYSQGMKKKLALAGLLLHDPQVLLLDEPFESLDPLFVRRLQPTLTALARRGATIFITSHQLHAVEQVCSEVAVMVKGAIVFRAPTDQLRSRVKDELTQERYADLEDVFVSLVEAQQPETARRTRLSWIEG